MIREGAESLIFGDLEELLGREESVAWEWGGEAEIIAGDMSVPYRGLNLHQVCLVDAMNARLDSEKVLELPPYCSCRT